MTDNLDKVPLRCEITEYAFIRKNANGGFTAIMEGKGKRKELSASGQTAEEAKQALHASHVAWVQKMLDWIEGKDAKSS